MNSTPKINTFKNYTTGGWEYTYDLYDERTEIEGTLVDKGWVVKGGLSLKNVYHNGYSFAKDIRVICIWIFPNDTDRFQPKQLVLGPPDFIQQPITEHTNPFSPNVSKQIKAPLNFSSYNTETALEVKFVSKDPIFKDTKGQSRHLVVTQTYIFTDYNNEPRHEPSGVLMAARLFPITTILYGDESDGYINSVRIDYRLHLNLDGTLNYKANEVFNKLIKNNPDRFKLKNFPNQAAVFKDVDADADAAIGIISQLGGTEGVFFQVEKPLLLEIASSGIVDGTPYVNLKKNERGWDNIHWWGYRGEGQPIISAPGAFHAAHLHWRWGENIQSSPQFKSGTPDEAYLALTNNSNIKLGGPLVDPKVWIQTVKFAVVQNIKKFDINILSKENFFDIFNINNKPQPSLIENGCDNILYYSIQSKSETTIPERTQTIFYPRKNNPTETKVIPAKNVKASINGSYFIQGLFFGHEPEIKRFKVGSTTPEYFPSKTKVLQTNKWER